MSKAAPNRNAFTGGEFSVLAEGRTDLPIHATSMRNLLNYIPVPQGPVIQRSGSIFVMTSALNTASTLIPFAADELTTYMLEFGGNRIRFFTDAGLLVRAAQAVTDIVDDAPFLVFTSAALGASIGEQVVLMGLPADYNLNTRVLNITNKVGNDYTVDVPWPGTVGVAPVGMVAHRVYHIASPFTDVQAKLIRSAQSVDVMYLFCQGKRTQKLIRKDTYDWTIGEVLWQNGPFLPADDLNGILTISEPWGAVDWMTGASAPAPFAATASTEAAGHEAWRAFNGNPNQYWEPTTDQGGWVQVDLGSARNIVGYTIWAPAIGSTDPDYQQTDYAPASWDFEGSLDGVSWATLDERRKYVLYDNNRSIHFKLRNQGVVYRFFRLTVHACVQHGAIKPRVAMLSLTGNPNNTANGMRTVLTLTGTFTALNRGVGFLSTDVGRLLRVKGFDGYYRTLRIAEYIIPTQVYADILSEPFGFGVRALEWRVGYLSDSTGWPIAGTFLDDRLWIGGSGQYSDLLAGSRVGSYEDFEPSTPLEEVQDDHGIAGRLTSRRLVRINWLESDERGLIVGTGVAPWTVSATSDGPIHPRSMKARQSAQRGAQPVAPVKVDENTLYIQLGGRSVRELSFDQSVGGYRAPSMSILASHLTKTTLKELDYQGEPYSVVWARRDDGVLLGMTYYRNENIVGWHRHDLAGAFVESIAVMPAGPEGIETLWLVCRRTVNAQTKYYIEKLAPFWDFTHTIDDAHFVDSGLRVELGSPTTTFYGLTHLEGKSVVGIADRIPFEPRTVVDGRITLPVAASSVCVGLAMEAFGEIGRIEAGAMDGTAQGKIKRIHEAALSVWDSALGELGVWNTDLQEYQFAPIDYAGRDVTDLREILLQTGIFGPTVLPPSYSKDGTMAFRQKSPVPLHIMGLMPRMETQDDQ